MQWSADFETTVDVNDCRVWAWAVSEIGNVDNAYLGTTIDQFVDFMRLHGGEYYFHNAAFDGEFLISHLFRMGFTYSDKMESKTFRTLISDTGKFYQMEICFEKKARHKSVTATVKDSLKKLPMSVDAVAKAFRLPISKLSIDYKEKRTADHVLTAEESAYILNDVNIVNMALKTQFDAGLTKLTVGSDALASYKNMVGSKFKDWFPTLNVATDAMIRKAYRGGWTYANPIYQADPKHSYRVWGAGSVYDVNSLYPSRMYYCPMPVGVPVYFEGEYKPVADYPLYIQFMTCALHLKKDHLPMIQIKNNPFFAATEYVTDTEGTVDLALTNVDLKLMFDQYDVDVVSYNGGLMFRQATGLFNNYIDHWMEIKSTTTGGMRQLAKLMLNSLYGKFATNPHVQSKIPYLKDDGSVGYMLQDPEERAPVYTAVAAFVTAWGRDLTVRSAQAVYKRFMYADTDSIHVMGTRPVEGIEVHPSKLGAWKHESNFDRAKYLRAKSYIERVVETGETVDGVYQMVPCEPHLDVKCAGLPKALHHLVTFGNFKRGLVLPGKLRPKHVPGGIVLVDTTFTLK